jgi:MraZ protein
MSLVLNTALFLATHTNRIDGKGRVSLPAPFRSALAARSSQGVMIYKSPWDSAIEGVTVERMAQMHAGLESLSANDPKRAYFELTIFGTAQNLQLDSEGRCALPKALLEKIGIKAETGAEIAFLGRGATFQIWEPGKLAAKTEEAAEKLLAGDIAFPTLPAGGLV